MLSFLSKYIQIVYNEHIIKFYAHQYWYLMGPNRNNYVRPWESQTKTENGETNLINAFHSSLIFHINDNDDNNNNNDDNSNNDVNLKQFKQ